MTGWAMGPTCRREGERRPIGGGKVDFLQGRGRRGELGRRPKEVG
jgi:hypothetical protein